MNKQQRLLIFVLIAVAVILLAAIIGINLARRPTVPAADDLPAATEALAATAEPDDSPIAGLTEEEIAEMAMQEEHESDYVSSFDDDANLDETYTDPNATEEPID